MSEKITHVALGEEIAVKLGLSKSKGAEFARLFIEEIGVKLQQGVRVELTGIASFSKERTEARTGRNPATGKEIKIPAKNRLKVATSQKIKELLN